MGNSVKIISCNRNILFEKLIIFDLSLFRFCYDCARKNLRVHMLIPLKYSQKVIWFLHFATFSPSPYRLSFYSFDSSPVPNQITKKLLLVIRWLWVLDCRLCSKFSKIFLLITMIIIIKVWYLIWCSKYRNIFHLIINKFYQTIHIFKNSFDQKIKIIISCWITWRKLLLFLHTKYHLTNIFLKNNILLPTMLYGRGIILFKLSSCIMAVVEW